MDQLPKDRIGVIPVKQPPEHLVSASLKKTAISLEDSHALLVEGLKKLAYREGTEILGDSKTNILAQRALVRAGIQL